MYIIAIGWLYVTLLMAAAETTVVAGVMTFLLYGAAPLALLLWLFGTPQRRRGRLRQQAMDEPDGNDDGGDTRTDQ
jgi:membrane protein implicated in regulation of membrane protease activity